MSEHSNVTISSKHMLKADRRLKEKLILGMGFVFCTDSVANGTLQEGSARVQGVELELRGAIRERGAWDHIS